MSSIFRQLSIEADKGTAEELGIEFDENESDSKKVNIVNKDSVVIHRSVSIVDLKKLIRKLYSLEQSKDLFALNYLVLAKKKRLKNADLFDALLETLSEQEFDKFVLAGDDYTSFYTCADRYVLRNEENVIILEQEAPIQFMDVALQIPDGKYSKKALRTMLKKWTISTIDNAGSYVLYPLSIFDAIQGFIEIGPEKNPCYLFNGSWYVFDDKFTKTLTAEFKSLYIDQERKVDNLIESFGLKLKASSEDTYNALLRDNPNVIVAHTALMDYVEIADAIFWDDEVIYLMHNKAHFSGSGSRDVTNQVLTSAEYLQQNLISFHRTLFLETYYEKIAEKYFSANKKIPVTKAKFIEVMTSGRTISYVIGYMKEYKKESHTTYAKYLTIEITKKLSVKGYGCITIGIN